eukprot:CAMPEP_0202441862 /NCGR_PEP_ID=MMETSP1360-20130828/1379_1 /ASSEMBLY_ACC=CAM_ASM_000848 /TAXON_ID=515479 /ORGANISM="Licmophora paradoxa, Strain CCMP2313" /LENGTH=123 /DNA_ID=CAMNT_0049057037 /DNA_START=42 /DNA_END=413 /DNA_ORIENTATION=-
MDPKQNSNSVSNSHHETLIDLIRSNRHPVEFVSPPFESFMFHSTPPFSSTPSGTSSGRQTDETSRRQRICNILQAALDVVDEDFENEDTNDLSLPTPRRGSNNNQATTRYTNSASKNNTEKSQ